MAVVINYLVEHLATLSTLLESPEEISPKMAIQQLFEIEKSSGIWSQRMIIQIEGNLLALNACLNIAVCFYTDLQIAT